jgi:hypothetical protein
MSERENGQLPLAKRRGRSRISADVWEQVKTAYATGSIGLREIARNMNIPEGTVLARAKREGWTQQIQSAKALAKREDALAVTPVQAVAASMQQRGERHVERMAGVSERGVDHIETMDGPEILNSVDQIEKLDKVARRAFGLKDDNPYIGFSLNVLTLTHSASRFATTTAIRFDLRCRSQSIAISPCNQRAVLVAANVRDD